MFGGTMGSMLEGKPEEEVYELMIDSHRMRMEDECNFQGKFQGLYGGEDPVPGFRQFLDKAETKQGLLPAWWTPEKRDACIAFGNRRNHWNSLHSKVDKKEIQDHYKNGQMPMQLRMLAEEIIGTNVMG